MPSELTQFKKGHKLTQRENNPIWKGGRQIDEKGYVRINIAPNKWKYEHRLVMEKEIGRELDFNETIHHLNHNKQDNRLENLELLSRSDHSKLYHSGKQLGIK